MWLNTSNTQENKLKCCLKIIREFNKVAGYYMSKNQTEKYKKKSHLLLQQNHKILGVESLSNIYNNKTIKLSWETKEDLR